MSIHNNNTQLLLFTRCTKNFGKFDKVLAGTVTKVHS